MSESPEAAESQYRPPDAARALDDVLTRCYRHLGVREHSAADLRARLERARVTPALIDQALEIVVEQGYVNDERYARLLVEDRRTIDGWGAERIRDRLRAAGIERDLIDAALDGSDHASELAAAVAVLDRRCRVPLTDNRERQRAFGILARLGYGSDVAYDAIRRAGGGTDDWPPGA
jgi:regulatory protein